MTLPTMAAVNTAVNDAYAALADRKWKQRARAGVASLNEVYVALAEAYIVDQDFVVTDVQDGCLYAFMQNDVQAIALIADDLTVTDTQDIILFNMLSGSTEMVALIADDLTVTDTVAAAIAEFFAGELATGLGAAPAIGDIFKVAGTGDTTDNALETAKGGAVADEDMFVVSAIASGSEAVVFLGNTATLADGEIWEGLTTVVVGDIIKVAGTGDTTDNALQAAKGSAPADEDMFIVLDVDWPGKVGYLGNTATIVDGELQEAYGRAPAALDIFQVGGTGDTIDNALEASKGSAVADGDIFQVTDVTAAAAAVTYLGLAGDLDFTGEELVGDFVALA